jgi:hypothetical protein
MMSSHPGIDLDILSPLTTFAHFVWKSRGGLPFAGLFAPRSQVERHRHKPNFGG